MSFRSQDLSVLAYANGFTHWHYRTQDSLAALLAPSLSAGPAANDNIAGEGAAGYFAGAAELFRPGDQITVNLVARHRTDLAVFAVTSLRGLEVELAMLTAPGPARIENSAA